MVTSLVRGMLSCAALLSVTSAAYGRSAKMRVAIGGGSSAVEEYDEERIQKELVPKGFHKAGSVPIDCAFRYETSRLEGREAKNRELPVGTIERSVFAVCRIGTSSWSVEANTSCTTDLRTGVSSIHLAREDPRDVLDVFLNCQ